MYLVMEEQYQTPEKKMYKLQMLFLKDISHFWSSEDEIN